MIRTMPAEKDLISREGFITYLLTRKEFSGNDFDNGKMFERDAIVSCLKSYPAADHHEILEAANAITSKE